MNDSVRHWIIFLAYLIAALCVVNLIVDILGTVNAMDNGLPDAVTVLQGPMTIEALIFGAAIYAIREV